MNHRCYIFICCELTLLHLSLFWIQVGVVEGGIYLGDEKAPMLKMKLKSKNGDVQLKILSLVPGDSLEDSRIRVEYHLKQSRWVLFSFLFSIKNGLLIVCIFWLTLLKNEWNYLWKLKFIMILFLFAGKFFCRIILNKEWAINRMYILTNLIENCLKLFLKIEIYYDNIFVCR